MGSLVLDLMDVVAVVVGIEDRMFVGHVDQSHLVLVEGVIELLFVGLALSHQIIIKLSAPSNKTPQNNPKTAEASPHSPPVF